PEAARSRHAVDSLRHADGHLLLLDERGEQLTTAELAERVSRLESAGTSRLTLFLGGPDGHGPELRRAAHGALALSRLTLPHDLARVVLLGRLSRTESLGAGPPSHRPWPPRGRRPPRAPRRGRACPPPRGRASRSPPA